MKYPPLLRMLTTRNSVYSSAMLLSHNKNTDVTVLLYSNLLHNSFNVSCYLLNLTVNGQNDSPLVSSDNCL